MTRGIGEFDIQAYIPEWAAVVIALLTQLGDIWFLALLLTVLYWSGVPDHNDVAGLAGVWVAGMGLYKGLKEIFEFPRPEQPLLDPNLLPWVIELIYRATAFASGYGFPSGHAVNTTVVFFGLAHILRFGTLRQRVLVAGIGVTVVSFTRVALGVHYLVDVVAGAAVGAAILGGAWLLMGRRPGDRVSVAFALAVGLSGFFMVSSRADSDAIFLLGASLGAFGGWQVVVLGRQLVVLERPSDTIRPIVVRGGLASVSIAPLAVSLEVFPPLSVYATGGVVGLVTAGIVILPILRHSERARRVGRALLVWVRLILDLVQTSLRRVR